MLSKLKPHTLFILLLSVSAGILIYFSYYNEFYEGGPDTIWHYYFSKYALYNTQFFLHHWGKPFFILLSTWFAQFGFLELKYSMYYAGLLLQLLLTKSYNIYGFHINGQ
ncbi:MAG: hypothetical protein IPJ66_11425 [Bacteroidetes bacterium]|nr:hypothetical protein [Bacteroidota bacterium]